MEENKNGYEKAQKIGWHCYCTSKDFDVDEFKISIIHTSHDAKGSVGFIIYNDNIYFDKLK